MRVASNRSRVTDLAPTSIRAALELLTEDKSEEAQSALDIESFEQYGEVKRGLSGPRLYQLAKAAEVQMSLPDYTNGIKDLSERTLRPLAPLSEDERRQVWEEATADTLAAEYQVSPATRAHRHRHLPSDRARGTWGNLDPGARRRRRAATENHSSSGWSGASPGGPAKSHCATLRSENPRTAAALVLGDPDPPAPSALGVPSEFNRPRPALFFAGES